MTGDRDSKEQVSRCREWEGEGEEKEEREQGSRLESMRVCELVESVLLWNPHLRRRSSGLQVVLVSLVRIVGSNLRFFSALERASPVGTL